MLVQSDPGFLVHWCFQSSDGRSSHVESAQLAVVDLGVLNLGLDCFGWWGSSG